MKTGLTVICSALTIAALSACSTYQVEDYGDADVANKASTCTNMEPAQALKCKEREQSLLIGLGADENCNHPYEYERNRCKGDQAKTQKALEESLKKHTDK